MHVSEVAESYHLEEVSVEGMFRGRLRLRDVDKTTVHVRHAD